MPAAGKGKGDFDERDMIPEFVTAIAGIRPRIFVMENVRGLTFKKHAEYLQIVLDEFRALGYELDYRVLNAADYGVPQTRQRFFLIGRNDGQPIRWPSPTHAKGGKDGLAPWITMAQALGWETPRIDNTRGLRTTPGGNEFPADQPSWAITGKSRSWKLHTNRDQRPDGSRQVVGSDRPAPTLTAKSGGQWEWATAVGTWPFQLPSTTVAGDPRVTSRSHHYGPVPSSSDHDPAGPGSGDYGGTEPIKLTVEEAALLQAFPGDWEFIGSRTSQFQQIGNACPPDLIRAVIHAQVNGTFIAVDRSTFAAAISAASPYRKGNSTVADMLGEVPDDGVFVLSHDRLTGFAVAEGDELRCLFNVGPAGRGGEACDLAKDLGARRLDCFEGFLVDFYAAHGWTVYCTEDNWDGPEFPKVAFMGYFVAAEVAA